MNPLNNPSIHYLRAMLAVRVDRARAADTTRGASAIEWAIITGILAVIAVTVGAIILNKLREKANSIDTDPAGG